MAISLEMTEASTSAHLWWSASVVARFTASDFWLIQLGLTVVLSSAPTLAQTIPLETAPVSPSGQPIVVTALRWETALDKTAAPVSLVTGESARISGVTGADRLAALTNSLTVLPNATGNLMFIRGVGNFTLTANSEPAVGWNYDGVFIARPIGTNGQFFDMSRYELLKGPQGVLYGRNASAGTVNLVPNQPALNETSAFASLSYASHEAIYGEAFANLPVGQFAAFRASGQFLDQANDLTGYGEGPRQASGRIQLLVNPNDTVSIRLLGDYSALRGTGLGTTYLGYYRYDPTVAGYQFNPSGVDLSDGIYSPAAQRFRETVPLMALGRRLNSQMGVPRQNNDLYGAHAEIIAQLGSSTLTVLPAWRVNEIDQLAPGAPFEYRQNEKQEQHSIEARFNGKAGPVDWMLGTFLFDEEVAPRYALNFSMQLSLQDQLYTTRSRALFANVRVAFLPGFLLSAGIRQSWDRKYFEAQTTSFTLACRVTVAGRPSCPTVPLFQLGENGPLTGLPLPEPGAPPLPVLVDDLPTGAVVARSARADEGVLDSADTTWRMSAEVDVGGDGIVYGTVETGYRPGGFNTATGMETFRPEYITAYTLGLRYTDRSAHLKIAAELFWWDYRNQQVSSVQPDLSSPPRNVNLTRNVARSRIRGADLELSFRPKDGTQLFAKVQYLDAAYRSFVYIQANTGVPPLTGCASVLHPDTNLYSVDCSSQRPFASPEWTMTLGAHQRIEVDRLRLDLMAHTRYVSAQNIGAAFLAEQRVPAHWRSEVQLIFSERSSHWELAGFVRNIEGKRSPTFVIFHPVTNLVVASTTPPRTWGARFSYWF